MSDESVETATAKFVRLRRWAAPLWLVALAAAVTRHVWLLIWVSGVPRAWDGTGHYGVAQIYSASIFPDTFGWTGAYFTGMPLPNFYPPLFYWLVSLLSHTGLIPFEWAFKLVLCLPILLLPALIWKLAFEASGRDAAAAVAATVIALVFMIDLRTWRGGIPTGLDYYSTFQVGLYTQPLGFSFFILWLLTYHRLGAWREWRFPASGLLLALAMLGNFFVAITAAFFVAAAFLCDLYACVRAPRGEARARRRLLARAASPLAACALSLFWLLPMLKSYAYVVTRPYIFNLTDLVSAAMWGLCALAAAGFVAWGRRRNTWFTPYLLGCGALAAAVALTTLVAPDWFPLQPQRFIGALSLLLCVPAGCACAAVYRFFYGVLSESSGGGGKTGPAATRRVAPFPYASGALVLLITVDALLFIQPPFVGVGFYPKGGSEDVRAVLDFASRRRDGRYLVEADMPAGEGKFDARAINAYLGAQGNETLSAIFHEASPNSLFFLPLINVFSGKADSFGISSRLTDDKDFAELSLRKHAERAALFGVRYLVIRSPEVKLRLDREAPGLRRSDFGAWSVYELGAAETGPARALPYKPALVVGGLNLKQRRRDESDFVRLAEEQFADGWFQVMLARSSELKIDRLENLDAFGALVVGEYACDDEGAAYELLRRYAARHPLILLPNDSRLFGRVRSNLAEFQKAHVVGEAHGSKTAGTPDDLFVGSEPTLSYRDDPVRRQWTAVRELLDANKEPVEGGVGVSGRRGADGLALSTDAEPAGEVPVLVADSFHPGWRRDDGGRIYAATPFHMLTFVRGPVRLTYGRDGYEVAAVWVSLAALIVSLALLVRALFFAARPGVSVTSGTGLRASRVVSSQ